MLHGGKRPTFGSKDILLALSLVYFLISIMAGLATDTFTHEVFTHVILLYLGLTVVRHLAFLFFAMGDKPPRSTSASESSPLVSIIVPAYNEDAVIEDALHGLMNLRYPHFEVLVVDDGSTDRTAEIARAVAADQPKGRIRVLSQSNAGKSSALNTGIIHAQGEFLLCVDADSRLAPNSLDKVFRYFDDPSVGAIGGYIAVRNPPSLLTWFQQLEYMLSLHFTRKALSYFGAVTVIPGPVGLFRREAIQSVGGYREDHNVFAEDADLTVRLLSAGWRIKGCSEMVSATEAPGDVFALLRQRYRWKRGIYQAFHDNIYGITSTGGVRGAIIGLFLALESFALPIMNFGLTLFLLAHFLHFGDLQPMLHYYLLLVSLDLLTLLYVFSGPQFKLRWIGVMLLEKFTYSYLLQAWGVFSLLDEWRSAGMTWDKLERAGQAS